MTTKKWSEVRGRLVPADMEGAAAGSRRALRDTLGLGRIRAERRVTQVELAARLDRSQGNVSELEHRSDVYLSSLREYVEALGGELEVTAVFDGKRHPIAPLRGPGRTAAVTSAGPDDRMGGAAPGRAPR